jgi:hypothetical protein
MEDTVMKLIGIRWASYAALVLGGTACDQSPTAVPVAGDLPLAAAVVPADNAGAAQVVVCKEGPAGKTYDFTVAGNTGAVDLPLGGTFSLVNDECKTVATTAGAVQSATVVESAPPAGTLFDRVEVWEYFTGNGQTTLNRTELDPEVTLSPFGNDRGLVVIYKNIAAPSTGCTLTLGYWKTHNNSFPGGAAADPTWNLLPGGLAENTTFFLSGQTWFQVFWTPVGGNAYYNLAHQYMAARLNYLAGAPTIVTATITTATGLFNTYTPADIAALSGKDSLRKQFISLAGILGSYNEGTLSGADHCGA